MSKILTTDIPADPPNPAVGTHALYSKATGLFVKDSAGMVVGPLSTGGGGGVPGGDLGGLTIGTAVVEGLQGNPILSGAPSDRQYLGWNGAAWAPSYLNVGPDNVAYLAMSPRGNDTTGVLGDASRPYASFTAALAALTPVSGIGALVMGPGDFGVNASPPWPVGPTKIAFLGAGQDVTRVFGAGSILKPDAAMTSLVLDGFTLEPNPGTLAIEAHSGSTSFMSEGMYMRNMKFVTSGGGNPTIVSIRGATLLFIADCQDLSIFNATVPIWDIRSSNAWVSNVIGAQVWDLEFDVADPNAPQKAGVPFRTTSEFSSTSANFVRLSKQADVRFDATTKIETIEVKPLTTLDFVVVGPDTYAPRVEVHGVCDNADFTGLTGRFPDSSFCRANFRGASVSGTLAFEVGPTFVNRLNVNCDGVVLGSGALLDARDGVDISARTDAKQAGSTNFTTAGGVNGTIRPSSLSLIGPVPSLILFGFTAPSPPVSVQATAIGFAGGALFVAATTATDLTIAGGPAAATHVDVRW